MTIVFLYFNRNVIVVAMLSVVPVWVPYTIYILYIMIYILFIYCVTKLYRKHIFTLCTVWLCLHLLLFIVNYIYSYTIKIYTYIILLPLLHVVFAHSTVQRICSQHVDLSRIATLRCEYTSVNVVQVLREHKHQECAM